MTDEPGGTAEYPWGERGPAGDHGQDGQQGYPGKRGEVGLTGERGTTGRQGQVGQQGKRGMRGPVMLNRAWAVTVGAFVVLSYIFGVLLTFRSDSNSDRIQKNSEHLEQLVRQQQQDFEALCQTSRENSTSMTILINQVIEQIAALPADNPRREEFLTNYRAAIPTIPDCTDRP